VKRLLKRVIPKSKAALALGGFLAIPVFFASLMAASLAVEKAHVIEWNHGTKLYRVFHTPTAATEAKIWLLAAIPPLLLVLFSLLASHFPYGIYLTCGAACVVALALTVRLHRWEVHHTTRFPYGEDLLPDSTTSSSIRHGQWEQEAAATVRSLVHYTIGLALAAVIITLFLTVRRRRSAPLAAA
jgi:hypothetical protein